MGVVEYVVAHIPFNIHFNYIFTQHVYIVSQKAVSESRAVIGIGGLRWV